ncbi:signal transduction histidine kinase [Peptoniphilus olsenii]|uniref:histidine kinase n=1 Tax=Peptoniphilus olsenii TaxID=411570 RepID=A0ABV2JBC1_9FIRM
MIYLLYILSLVFLYYFLNRKKQNRIKQLENLIDRLGKKDYSIPMIQDEFSLLEDKIYKIFTQLIESREELDKNSKKQIENLENIAHQVKTPITSMLFDLETLSTNEDNREKISRIEFQLNRLNSLSDILLKLSSLDSNVDNMQKREVLISEVIDYTVDILRDDIEYKNISIISDVHNYIINADYYWVCEAFINILKNAINLKNISYIKVSASKNPIYTQILVEDDGGGIDEKCLNKVFQRFYKTPDSNGFGIGLAMAKTIIENNNGNISVKNAEEGAVFDIKFYNVT